MARCTLDFVPGYHSLTIHKYRIINKNGPSCKKQVAEVGRILQDIFLVLNYLCLLLMLLDYPVFIKIQIRIAVVYVGWLSF